MPINWLRTGATIVDEQKADKTRTLRDMLLESQLKNDESILKSRQFEMEQKQLQEQRMQDLVSHLQQFSNPQPTAPTTPSTTAQVDPQPELLGGPPEAMAEYEAQKQAPATPSTATQVANPSAGVPRGLIYSPEQLRTLAPKIAQTMPKEFMTQFVGKLFANEANAASKILGESLFP